jgi:hypothetical protein
VTERPRVFAVLGFSAAVVVTAFALVGFAGSGDQEKPAAPVASKRAPVTVAADVTPRTHLFGDTLTARIDLVIDREAVGPARPRVERSFAPYVVERATISRRDAGRFSQVRYTFRLRCLVATCISPSGRARVRFAPVHVFYRSASGKAREARTTWPSVELYTRLASVPREEQSTSRFATPVAAPWRADLVSVPPVSDRASPTLLVVALLLAAGLLLLPAGVLAYRALPRRTSPSWEAWLARLAPLDRALAVLERARTEGDATARRRALERLGMELRARGAEGLARAALELAWAEAAPTSEAISRLEQHVRPAGEGGRRRAA